MCSSFVCTKLNCFLTSVNWLLTTVLLYNWEHYREFGSEQSLYFFSNKSHITFRLKEHVSKLRLRSFYKYPCLSVGLSVCQKNCFTLKNTFESLTYKSKLFKLCEWIPKKFLDFNPDCNWTVLTQFNPIQPEQSLGTNIQF